MSEIAKYEAYKKKLQGVCDENNLVFRFRHDRYPITLTIRPVSGLGQQLNMLESVEENGYTSPDAAIVFAYKNGALTYKTSETFTISDALFSKIKNLYKNMHSLWLQYFFRDVIEKIGKGALTAQNLPKLDEDEEASEFDVELDDDPINGIEPLEVDDEEESDGSEDAVDDTEADDEPVEDTDEQPEGSDDDYDYERSEADDTEA